MKIVNVTKHDNLVKCSFDESFVGVPDWKTEKFYEIPTLFDVYDGDIYKGIYTRPIGGINVGDRELWLSPNDLEIGWSIKKRK